MFSLVKSRRRPTKSQPPRRSSKANSSPKTYKGKLPSHVKKYFVTIKGKRRPAYFSKITGRRIRVGVIRRVRSDQAIAERFPTAGKKGLRNIKSALNSFVRNYKDMGRAERKVLEDRYQSLFKYVRKNDPGRLPEYHKLAGGITDENDSDTGENDDEETDE